MSSAMRQLLGPEYPVRLRDLADPPPCLWVVGEMPRGPAVAIVGTRTPTKDASTFAFELSRDLARQGVNVFSGGAEGIDSSAHRGALEGHGATVVVAPASYEHPFPSENARLFQAIVARGGAYATTYRPGTKAHPSHFFERNAVLAALVEVMVVVETRFRGGARNAAKQARRLGRKVLVVPHAPWNPAGGGCLLEIRAGAELATSLNDVLLALGLPPVRTVPAPGGASRRPSRQPVVPSTSELPGSLPDPDREAVMQVLRIGPGFPDDICQKTSLSPGRVQALLLTLTLEKIVVSEPSGRVLLVNTGID